MALMDAGIPLRAHVAGVSVGLITDVDPSSGEIKDYRIVTDILVSSLILICCLFFYMVCYEINHETEMCCSAIVNLTFVCL